MSDEDGTQSVRNKSTKCLHVELAAGDAILLRLQDAKEEAFAIDYVLRK